MTEGDRALLNCSVAPADLVILGWIQRPNREVVTDQGKHVKLNEDGSLVFDMIQKEQEGFYQCQAKINDSRVSHTHWAYVKVNGKGIVSLANSYAPLHSFTFHFQWIIIVPALLYEYTTNSTVRHGTRFEAKCYAEGDPLPIVVWYMNDVEVLMLNECI